MKQVFLPPLIADYQQHNLLYIILYITEKQLALVFYTILQVEKPKCKSTKGLLF